MELHDDAVLGWVVWDGVANRGRHRLARLLARHGRVGRGDERSELDLR